jgi:lipid A 3-O-deacylase PagL
MRGILLAILLSAGTSFAAEPEFGVVLGRALESQDTDIVRLTYRRPVESQRWWAPTHLQYGLGIWRVPDFEGRTRRFDLSATPVWRAERSSVYVEGGIGAYFLSHTINNDTNRLPSSLQFGSHIGAGVRFGGHGQHTIGIALQHLSNGGIKQPNGGINFVLLTATFQP